MDLKGDEKLRTGFDSKGETLRGIGERKSLKIGENKRRGIVGKGRTRFGFERGREGVRVQVVLEFKESKGVFEVAGKESMNVGENRKVARADQVIKRRGETAGGKRKIIRRGRKNDRIMDSVG